MQGGKLRALALAAVSALALGASSTGLAQDAGSPGPSAAAAATLTPPPPLPGAAERMRLRDGMAAAQSGDWFALAQLRDSSSDPLIRKMLQWRYATAANAPLSFSDQRRALEDLQGWPGRSTMRTRAEQAIFDSPLSASERIAFLRQEEGPLTGDGRIALALALRENGQRSEALAIARASWREDSLSDTAESRARLTFGDDFSSDDYAARVDALLWREQRTAANRLLGQISSADRLLAQARMALQVRQRRGLQAAVDAVPASRTDNPGLLFDRTQYIRQSGRPEDALPVAARIDARTAPLFARDDIYRERRLYVPRALRNGNSSQAYQLVSNSGLSSGEEFADGEWMSGWLQLRYMRNPSAAAAHFEHLDANVSSPVSSSRALYWRAEAASALGRNDEARDFRERAARFNFTYYGQLAAVRANPNATLSLPPTTQVSAEVRNRFENRELVRALRLMTEVGARSDFESIAFYLDDTLEEPQEIELLAQMAREQAYPRTALRSAKAGLFRNVVAVDAAYPLLELPAAVRARSRPEPALVLAIIRQESEFEPSAVSHANAHGLMQLLPTTASMTARREGMSYDRSALTTNPNYNMTLGSAYLGQMIDEFNGSYILAIASYNAGSGRAREWIADWGDPRSPRTDVVDWVELIPFNETRNYVQRVMENLQVYRYRLAGQPTRITIEQDLRRGG
ncbi:MAG: lytic transglycosylase domain-containing protein [Hyphomonadaceae bacterium]|nr:lytic transglycosylase domain-containing protein [Hyphomonadaceae bacterium]